MKKIIILLFLFTCLAYESFAQDKVTDFYENSYPLVLESCTKSPVTARLFSFQDFPFRHSTGQVDIQIPIQELTINTLSIPMVISYNSSGIKIQDNPGIIGFGWSLNCGFKISRSIRGKNDLEYPVNQDRVLDFCSSSPLDYDYIRQLIKIAPEDAYNIPNDWEDGKMDGQHDIFNIELPGINATFILEYNDGVYSVRTFNSSSLSIKLLITEKKETRYVGPNTQTRSYSDLYGIEVTDDNGICYKFGETEQRDVWELNKYTEYNKQSARSGLLKTGWMLREVIISTGNIVRFSYKDAVDYSDFQPTIITSVIHGDFEIKDVQAASENDYWILTGDTRASIWDKNHIQHNMNLSWIRYKNKGFEDYQNDPEPTNFKLIRSISNSWIDLEFNYDSIRKIGNPKLPAVSAYYRQNLSNLRVYSKINNERLEKIKEINLYNHEGFLDSLSISGNGKYKFSYDRGDKKFSTEQFQKAIDWWGYCNGKNNVSSLPRNDSDGDAASKRNPDSLFTKARALNEIVYPTGGMVRINYGTHVFRDGTYGGGLRVESLETIDPSSGKILLKRFKYGNPRYSGIPVTSIYYNFISRTHLYAGKDVTLVYNGGYSSRYHAFAYEVNIDAWSTFTFPLVYTPYTSFNVWYENVVEENDEGKIEYKFEYTPTAEDPEFLDGIIDYTMSHREPSLIRQRAFKKNEAGGFDLVRSVVNTYTHDFVFLNEVNVIGSYREMSTCQDISRRGSYEDLPGIINNSSLYPSRLMRTLGVGQVSLKKTQETLYFKNDSTTTYTNYLYDKERPYNLAFKAVSLVDRDLITYKYYYSNNQLPANKGITIADHGLSDCLTHKTAVIQQEIRRNSKIVGGDLTCFKTVNSTQKVPKEKYYIGSNGIMEKREEYPLYDTYGNPVEVIKDKHSRIIRIWSYGGMYPVAEIKNATYQQVENALGGLAGTLPQGWLSDQIWSTLNNKLRSAIDLKNAFVTTYRYKPLVGVIEIMDPRGKSIYYNYDTYGRLKETYMMENGNKKLLQENEYKYYDEK